MRQRRDAEINLPNTGAYVRLGSLGKAAILRADPRAHATS